MAQRPVSGVSYTLAEIYKLSLRDGPSLNFHHNDISGVIQESHLTEEELLSVPGMKESKWIYGYETEEWIPVFNFDKNIEQLSIFELVDLELWIDEYTCLDKEYWWATPKGFPRKQIES